MTPHAPTTATAPAGTAGRRTPGTAARRTAGVLAAAALALPLAATPPPPRASCRPRAAGVAAAARGAAAPEAGADARRARPGGGPEHEGKPYRYGAAGPDAFDCSGYVQHVFAAAGRELPRTSRDQYGASAKVDGPDRQPGDLIAVQDRRSRVTHGGICAGDDHWWVPSTGRDRVVLQRVCTERYAVGRFSWPRPPLGDCWGTSAACEE